jgi:hypothetical protein
MGNITEHGDHPCAVLHDDCIFLLLKKCHDYGVERMAEKDGVIAELKESIANARLD